MPYPFRTARAPSSCCGRPDSWPPGSPAHASRRPGPGSCDPPALLRLGRSIRSPDVLQGSAGGSASTADRSLPGHRSPAAYLSADSFAFLDIKERASRSTAHALGRDIRDVCMVSLVYMEWWISSSVTRVTSSFHRPIKKAIGQPNRITQAYRSFRVICLTDPSPPTGQPLRASFGQR